MRLAGVPTPSARKERVILEMLAVSVCVYLYIHSYLKNKHVYFNGYSKICLPPFEQSKKLCCCYDSGYFKAYAAY